MTTPPLTSGQRRLGISLPVQNELSITAQLTLITAADRVGYDWLVLGEIAGPEAFALLGAAAVSTTDIGLATGILSIYGRSPALLAMGFPTLDALAPARVVAGIGASSALIAADWHGRAFEQPI